MRIFLFQLICLNALSWIHAIDHPSDRRIIRYKKELPSNYGTRRIKSSPFHNPTIYGDRRKTASVYHSRPQPPYVPSRYKKSPYPDNYQNSDYTRTKTSPFDYKAQNVKHQHDVIDNDSTWKEILPTSFHTGYGSPNVKNQRTPSRVYEEQSGPFGKPKQIKRPVFDDSITSPTKYGSPSSKFSSYGAPDKGSSSFYGPPDKGSSFYGPPDLIPSSPGFQKQSFRGNPYKNYKGPSYLPKGSKNFYPPSTSYELPMKKPFPVYGPPPDKLNPFSSSSQIKPFREASKVNGNYPFKTKKPSKYPPKNSGYFGGNNVTPTGYNINYHNAPSGGNDFRFSSKPQSPKFSHKPQTSPSFPSTNYGSPVATSAKDHAYTHHTSPNGVHYETPTLSYTYSNEPAASHFDSPDAPPSQHHKSNDLPKQEDIAFELPQKSISYEFHTISNEGDRDKESYRSDSKKSEESNRYVRGSVTDVSPHTTQEEDDDQLKNVENHLKSSKLPPMGFTKSNSESEKDYNNKFEDDESVYGRKIINQEKISDGKV